MPQCQICACDPAEIAWQPLGPGSDANTFTTLGSHYRGFPVIKICFTCQSNIKVGIPAQFTINDQTFIGTAEKVYEVPKYVVDGDPLLWWEETCKPKGAA